MNKLRLIVLSLFNLLSGHLLAAGSFTLPQNQLDIVALPGFNHIPQAVLVTSNNATFNPSAFQVTSDSSWVAAEWRENTGTIYLSFTTSNLVTSQTATIRATDGVSTNDLFVHANVSPLNILRLVDDPARSRVYGVHASGLGLGSVVVVNPLSGELIANITVGKKPTDLAVSAAKDELIVLNTVDPHVTAIDLSSLTVSETVLLPEYVNWGAEATTGDIDYGPGDVIYYTDGSWAPLLYVFDRASRTIRQRVTIDSNGIGDFALTSDRQTLLAWAQYGWSAGWAGSYLARFSVAADGTMTFQEATESQWPTLTTRDPIDTPVLISRDDGLAFVKQLAVNPGSLKPTLHAFPTPVYAISAGGEIAITADAIFHTATGVRLLSLGTASPVQVMTSDYARLVYFDQGQRQIRFVDILSTIGPDVLGRSLSPAHQSVVLPPGKLIWSPLIGVNEYHVYLGTNSSAVQGAGSGSPEFLGNTTASEIAINESLEAGTLYYWRVDAVTDRGVITGDVHKFTVSQIGTSATILTGTTLQGYKSVVTTMDLTSASPGVAWQASSPAPWVTFLEGSGTTPGELSIVVDASQLNVGITNTAIQIAHGGVPAFSIPLRVRVEPLSMTILKSDPESQFVYGISEETQSANPRAYLLEIDTDYELITRIVEVGSSVTDLAIHNADGRIYVPNWKAGALLAVDKASFTVEKSFPFNVGYSDGDVYRVSAGVRGRLVVEEMDQWINLSIFDTIEGRKINGPGVREGGGGFEPSGRYYYHGENNSSGATIQKWDVTGDSFNMLNIVRVESASYYGSRVVTISESGNRIFWNGSVFNPDLAEEWTIGEHIYGTTPDGGYAFAYEKIYDIAQRKAVFGMPAATTVCAFNASSQKLVVQRNGRVEFFDLLTAPLPKPVLSAKTIANTSVALAWSDRSLETSFTVQMRQAGATEWSDIATPAQNIAELSVAQLQPETSYEFRIKANSARGSSDWSEVLMLSTIGTPPTTPVLFPPTALPRIVDLAWSDPDFEQEIVVERRETNEPIWSVLVRLPANTVTYSDTNVASGQTFEYRVYSTNQWTASTYSQVQTVLVPFPAPPNAPTITELRLLPGLAIRLGWAASAGAEQYRVERRPADATDWETSGTFERGTLQFTDTSVVAGRQYAYRVYALNEVGLSDPSAVQTLTAQAITCIISDTFDPSLNPTAWASVSGGMVASGNGFFEANGLWFGGEELRSAVTLPANVTQSTILEYHFRAGDIPDTAGKWDRSEAGESVMLEFSTDGITWIRLREFLGVTSWTRYAMQLPPQAWGPQTQFRWRQLRHSGASHDTWALDNVCLQGIAPPPPKSVPFVMVTPSSSTALALYWVSAPGATGYIIERISAAKDWTQIAVTGAAQTYFTDRGCLPSTTYAYRIKAFNAGGESDSTIPSFGTTYSQMEEWQVLNLGSTEPPMTGTGPDGVPHLVRYAFNLAADAPLVPLDPAQPTAGVPNIVLNETTGKIEITYLRRTAAMHPGLQYEVLFSNDLANWVAATEQAAVTPLNAYWEVVRVVDSAANNLSRFGKVAVRLNPE